MCYESGVYPTVWKLGVINPIPKSSTTDVRDPSLYRGITLVVASYKLFCSVLNSRLQIFAEENDLIHDEQNGFRPKRSCTDHLMSLVNIVSSRISKKHNLFAAFIDFKKAYDGINRELLWSKLIGIGIHPDGKFLKALKGIYNNVKCAVKVNGHLTNWFPVSNGLKQGCLLSPILFNLYINDLVTTIKQSCSGLSIGGENVCTLMYADDLVLLAKNENDLQSMLDALSSWCEQWQISINSDKSEVVHFRSKGRTRSSFVFKVGESHLKTVSKYRYLGLFIDEYLDYKVTADHVSKSAQRALGLIIAKSKAFGGIPFNCFKKMYESIVVPIINYGSCVWGQQQYSSINSVHNRACRYFLGVRKCTSNAAVQGDVGLDPPIVKQHESIARQWVRMNEMCDTRLNKKIFIWSKKYASHGCKNWVYKLMMYYRNHKLGDLLKLQSIDKKYAVSLVRNVVLKNYVDEWKKEVNRVSGKKCGRNKLRTYCKFKQDFATEIYVDHIYNRKWRSAYAKFRCGTAPISIELGRYEGLPENERTCPFCINVIENEVHVLTECSLYIDLRSELYMVLAGKIPNFLNMNNCTKTYVMLSSQDFNVVKAVAKTCSLILDRRLLHVK